MFDRNAMITAQIDAIDKAFGDLDRGDYLTHETIRGLLGLEPHEGRWDHILNRARARLERKRGIATLAEIGVGYRLLTIDDQLTLLPTLRLRRAKRQMRRAKRSVGALPSRGLSFHQRRLRMAQLQLLEQTNTRLAEESRTMARFSRKQETLPRHNPFAMRKAEP